MSQTPSKARALIILTSHDLLGNTGRRTGFYYEELATPYWAFEDAGLTVDIASILGGPAPHDPGSLGPKRPASVERFVNSASAMAQVADSKVVVPAMADQYRLFFLPGGHGTMWDFPQSGALATLLGLAFDRGAAIGAVCHGPSGLIAAKRADGKSILHDKHVNSFTNAEEAAVGLTDVVPFLLETRIRDLGGLFENAPNFQPYAVRDGQLVTGQNPMSSAAVADELLAAWASAR